MNNHFLKFYSHKPCSYVRILIYWKWPIDNQILGVRELRKQFLTLYLKGTGNKSPSKYYTKTSQISFVLHLRATSWDSISVIYPSPVPVYFLFHPLLSSLFLFPSFFPYSSVTKKYTLLIWLISFIGPLTPKAGHEINFFFLLATWLLNSLKW